MNREEFGSIVATSKRGGDTAVQALSRIFEWVDAQHLRDSFGGDEEATYYPWIPEQDLWPAKVCGIDSLGCNLFVNGEVAQHNPFNLPGRWQEVIDRLSAIPGVVIPEKRIYPNIHLSLLLANEVWQPFTDELALIVKAIRRSGEFGLR